ncbi:MAG: NAD(P)-dependent oxidoreductase [Brevinema sp.]
MKIASYGVRPIEIEFFHRFNKYGYDLTLIPELLTEKNVSQLRGCEGVILRGNCKADQQNLIKMKEFGIKYILTRTTGYDHIDLEAVKDLGFLLCAGVPSYSPNATSELAVSMALGLSRKTFAMAGAGKNFIADDRYFAKEVRHSVVGIIGMGRIGICSAKAFLGMGAQVLGYDPSPSEEAKVLVKMTDLGTLLHHSDIVLLHSPYIKGSNYHLVNHEFLSRMKDQAILVNTARGELIDLEALLTAIESNKLSGVGLDVLEGERDYFFKDFTGKILPNPIIEQLISYYPRVIITPHLGSFTDEALTNMIVVSYQNLSEFLQTGSCRNSLV